MPKIINIPGFTNDIASTTDNSLVIAAYGLEGSGKTRLLATMPGPVGVIPCDRKSRATIKKEMEQLGRKDIFMPKDDFIRHDNPTKLGLLKPDDAMKYYGEHVKAIMEASYTLLNHPDIRSVAVDGGSQLWEDILFKHYGRNQRIMPRDRGPANQDMIDFLAAMTGKHFAITLKADNKWVNDKPVEGLLEPKGMRQMGFHVTLIVEMRHNERYNPSVEREEFQWQFQAQVKHCQMEPLLQLAENGTLRDEMINFQTLASMVYPDADSEQFAMEQS